MAAAAMVISFCWNAWLFPVTDNGKKRFTRRRVRIASTEKTLFPNSKRTCCTRKRFHSSSAQIACFDGVEWARNQHGNSIAEAEKRGQRQLNLMSCATSLRFHFLLIRFPADIGGKIEFSVWENMFFPPASVHLLISLFTSLGENSIYWPDLWTIANLITQFSQRRLWKVGDERSAVRRQYQHNDNSNGLKWFH